ncbi:FAD-binding protein [Akkermansiaceae bacterium]|nr:FAD-binding protein [Akkermansiaceae bacterium]MDA7645882.1 FAD-binding protein [bacterium]MDA7529121.1 FAD-binding protein [Akkermansiaceae bacterium]MDA7660877.1 FAD-binding protein [Akkermansiaceae bacterium]MDA7789418.1 FAD-binding protein [Akkermansiaceae bacterium]
MRRLWQQESVISELRACLSAEKVSTVAEVLEEHGTDRWNFSHLPEVVVFAECRDDVVAVMKFANERGIPVTTRGAGVGYVGGCVPVEGGIALSVARMKSVVEIMPEDGVVVTQPGVILRDLQVAVSELGWYYPPDPASLNECSIGGNLATNAGGPRCLKYGVTKNYVLGLEVVLASGEILHVGGRCHKNKTGFDLLHLFVGSEGMLGVITEATLRIIPHPQTRAMLTATFPEFVDAAGAVQAILNSGHLPSALEITDEFTLKAARAYLGEGSLRPGKAHLIVEIDGRAKAVASELKELEKVLNEVGALSSEFHADEEACEKVWQLRRDFSYSLRATGLTKLNEDIVVPRSKLVELAAFAAGLEKKTGIPVACFGHAGDGNIHTNLMVEDYDNPVVREKADAALDVLFTWVLENGGVITGEHGVGLAKKPWIKDALGEVAFAAHHTVKNAFDPKGILNPGKFLD